MARGLLYFIACKFDTDTVVGLLGWHRMLSLGVEFLFVSGRRIEVSGILG